MNEITFEKLPEAVSKIIDSINNIERLLNQSINQNPETDRLFSIDDLCEYLPGNPAKVTIYGKVQRREIPHKKVGKRLMFLKSEIDSWVKSQGRETIVEIEANVSNYIKHRNNKK